MKNKVYYAFFDGFCFKDSLWADFIRIETEIIFEFEREKMKIKC